MGSSYIQADVLCPFYVTDAHKLKIICEGLPDETTCRTTFRTMAEWSNYITGKCCADYKACLLYKALLAKYE